MRIMVFLKKKVILLLFLSAFVSCTEFPEQEKEEDLCRNAAVLPMATMTTAYDPSWPGPDLNQARTDHTATNLKDGRILIAGGNNGTDYHSTASIFDPETREISSTIPMNHARSGHQAILQEDGTVLLLGGGDDTNSTLDTIDIFDPDTNTFYDPGHRMNSPRSDFSSAILADGRILITGGVDHTGSILATAEIYDGTTFSITGSMGGSRSGHFSTATLAGGFVFGGKTGSNAFTGSGESYQSGSWSNTTESLETPVAYGRIIEYTADRHFFLAGGVDSSGPIKQFAVLTFDSSGNLQSTQTKRSMVNANVNFATGIVEQDSLIYVFGGNNGTASLQNGDVYIVEEDTWIDHPFSLTTPREGHTANQPYPADPHFFFIAGGKNESGALRSTEFFSEKKIDKYSESMQLLALLLCL